MANQPTIHVFSKSNCGYCDRAKRLLQSEGLDFVEHKTDTSPAMNAASRFFSGRISVPQIFIGDQHVNGAEDLEALHAAGLLKPLLASAKGELQLDEGDAQKWEEGAEDFTLATVLDKVDLTKKLDDPENLLILHFYKGFFGFSPLSYLYMAIWPEAYKSCALSNVIATVPVLMMQLGQQVVDGVTYTASFAQGCAYCTVHTVAKDGTDQTDGIKALHAARDGNFAPDNPYGEFEVAMIELAEQATLNEVTSEQVGKLKSLAEQNERDPQQILEAVGLGAEIMALLNVFNDLVNVEIEGEMAGLAFEELGLDSGRHAVADGNPDDLSFELPETELTVETALEARREKVEDWQSLATQELGYIPVWLNAWPLALRGLFAGMYTELMADNKISAELKHLMARVAAIAKGHAAAAASAAVSAHHVAKDKSTALERIREAYGAATDQTQTDLFDAGEKLALRFAWLSAQTPIITPTRFAKPIAENFSQEEIVELSVACGMACAVQRMSAALQIELGADEAQFCREHGIETDIVRLKYPALLGEPEAAMASA